MKLINLFLLFLLFGCFNAHADTDEKETNDIVEKPPGISRSVPYQKPVIQTLPFMERLYIGIPLESDFIRDSFIIGVEIFVENLVENYVGNSKDLRKEIGTLNKEINKIEVALPSFSAVTKCLRGINATYLKSQYLSDKLEKLMSWIELMPVNFNLDEKTWKQEINNLSKRLKFLSSVPFFEIDEDKIIFFGGIVGTEDINKFLITFLKIKKSNDFKIKEVYIFAFKKLFIDQDVSLPGMNLQIITPNTQVVGERCIDLEPLSEQNHKKLLAMLQMCGNEDVHKSAKNSVIKKINKTYGTFKKRFMDLIGLPVVDSSLFKVTIEEKEGSSDLIKVTIQGAEPVDTYLITLMEKSKDVGYDRAIAQMKEGKDVGYDSAIAQMKKDESLKYTSIFSKIENYKKKEKANL